ncbi:MAG: redoxin domain-containing protein [Gemmataceae bacterium]
MRLPAALVLFTFTTSALADAPPVGTKIANLSFKDIRYVARSLDDFREAKAVALVFVANGCPLAERYLPTLQKLHTDYTGKGVAVVAVNVGSDDSIPAMAATALRAGCEFPVVRDFDLSCARAVGASRTPEAVILDATRAIRYRGRIDDQYRHGPALPAPTRNDLRDALDAVLAGKPVASPEVPADGCPITAPTAPAPAKPPVFAKDVAPILKTHCQECHRAGAVGPFALQTYEQVAKRAGAIQAVVSDGRMPPWFADPDHSTRFVNRRGLSEAERDTLFAWLRSTDRPRGDDRDLPAPLPPATEWRIGKPDQIVSTPTQDLPASGDIPYRYAILPTAFLHETWVQGVEIKADNGRALHHANLAFAKLGEKFSVENFITGQVPGGEAMALSDGVAVRIPAGSVLVLQMHFVTSGKPEQCKVSVGIRYARDTVQQRLRLSYLATTRYAIPPGAAAHRVAVSKELPCDAVGVGLFSHMHLRGKDMSFRAKTPDGKSEELLLIPNYSFSWQMPYRWEFGAKRFPKGTTLECVAHYDNSAFNPFNPDPKVTVRDGPQTHDEMMNGFVFYVDANEKLNLTIDPATGRAK